MSDDLEQWQWVDEDPFEKLLRKSKSAAEQARPAASADPPDRPEHLEQSTPHPAGTIESHERAVSSELSDPSTPPDRAVPLEKVEQWEETANSFRRALEIEPGRADALIGLGASLLHLDRAEEALKCFEQCVTSDAELERALLGKAVALQKLARNEQADRAYRELLQITPDSAEALANLIALSVSRQDAPAVARYSGRLLEVDPQSKAALQGLATHAIWTGDRASAVEYCTRLVEVDPHSYEYWCNLGFAKRIPVQKADAHKDNVVGLKDKWRVLRRA